MPNEFQFDVFLSHNAKDKAVVQPLAGRLRTCRAVAAKRRRKDGSNVRPVPPEPLGVGGFDEWVLAPGDSIPAKIGKGSAHSNILRDEGGQMCGCVEPTHFQAVARANHIGVEARMSGL